MKKSLFKVAISLMIFTLANSSVLAFYDDVTFEQQPYYNEIKFLHDLNRLLDEETNLFNPDALIDKAELYKLIMVFAGSEPSTEINLPYTDIAKDSPYAGYIQKAIELK